MCTSKPSEGQKVLDMKHHCSLMSLKLGAVHASIGLTLRRLRQGNYEFKCNSVSKTNKR